MFQFYGNCCIRNVDIQCLVYAIQSTNEVAVRLQAVHHEKQCITHTSRRDFASTLWVGEVFKLAGNSLALMRLAGSLAQQNTSYS